MIEEAFSNPMAPPEEAFRAPSGAKQQQYHPLRNEDFRKLLTTPRSNNVSSTPLTVERQQSNEEDKHSFTHRSAPVVDKIGEKISPIVKKGVVASGNTTETSVADSANSSEKGAKGGKRRSSHGTAGAHGKKTEQTDDSLTFILKNYRDRAAERRDGENRSMGALPSEAELLQLASAGAYRAVPGDTRTMLDLAERRKQAIQESKYLGGDMEHTHLVKGLDYSLLHKVRSEIDTKEQEDERMERMYQSAKEERQEVEASIKNPLVKTVYRLLFKDAPPKVNDMFGPRRMAYVVDLDEDFSDDIPTTLLRSKQECPLEETSSANLSTNDMVIQKLTQVLSYLRADTKRKKKEKLIDAEQAEQRLKLAHREIFDETAQYKTGRHGERDRKDKDRQQTYFEKSEGGYSRSDRDRNRNRDETGRRRDTRRDLYKERRDDKRVADQQDSRLALGYSPADLAFKKQTESMLRKEQDEKGRGMGSAINRPSGGTGNNYQQSSIFAAGAPKGGRARSKADLGLVAANTDSYVECYPGGVEMLDAANESDDEADYTKMDMGNRKGPVKRWDFESSQDYESYMTKKEALPKAAYQYGVKMMDGRRTRKTGTGGAEKSGKHKLDKQWNQINRILERRVEEGENTAAKRLRY